jgi:hypothetical protein
MSKHKASKAKVESSSESDGDNDEEVVVKSNKKSGKSKSSVKKSVSSKRKAKSSSGEYKSSDDGKKKKSKSSKKKVKLFSNKSKSSNGKQSVSFTKKSKKKSSNSEESSGYEELSNSEELSDSDDDKKYKSSEKKLESSDTKDSDSETKDYDDKNKSKKKINNKFKIDDLNDDKLIGYVKQIEKVMNKHIDDEDYDLDEKEEDLLNETNKLITKHCYKEYNEDELVEIYKIRNTDDDNKEYIGKANIFEKHGKKPPTSYGGKKRLQRHFSNAKSHDPKTYKDCPIFYEAIRDTLNENDNDKTVFKVRILVTVPPKLDKIMEELYTIIYKTYLISQGYNMVIGDKKALSGVNKIKLESAHAKGNKKRKVKKNPDNIGLPTNITCKYKTFYKIKKVKGKKIKVKKRKIRGYRVAMKIRSDPIREKSFMRSEYPLDVLLEFAKSYREELLQFEKNPKYKIEDVGY